MALLFMAARTSKRTLLLAMSIGVAGLMLGACSARSSDPPAADSLHLAAQNAFSHTAEASNLDQLLQGSQISGPLVQWQRCSSRDLKSTEAPEPALGGVAVDTV
jgi:hypothetical protein